MSRYRAQISEAVNRNTVVSLALRKGFNAYLPVYDGGVDFILYDEEKNELRKVQLKSRWTIDRKYLGRGIWVAFPVGVDWYLMPHDTMHAMAEADGVTATPSWTEHGAYSRPRLSAETLEQCKKYKFALIAEVAAEATQEGKDA